jgi:hypothetical protein
MSEAKYFNFPVPLLRDFMTHPNEVLENIMDYSLYSYALNGEENQLFGDKDEAEQIEIAKSSLGLRGGNSEATYYSGQELYDSIPLKSPKVGLNVSIFFDYYKNPKTDFERVCLLGFLAIKSILQNKAYCKITNAYWISRMDGHPSTVKDCDLSSSILKYNNTYQMNKIKIQLQLNWGLKEYSYYTRGFYVSFKLDKSKLAYEVEKKKDKVKIKNLKDEKKIARLDALNKIKNQNKA